MVWGFWFCKGLILVFTSGTIFFIILSVDLYFNSGVHLVLCCNHVLSIFFYDVLNGIKAFVNSLKCVSANCQTKTDYGPFLSLSFF